jgi:ubiquinone/menaquinone biosynthesis C-methylase UbiE
MSLASRIARFFIIRRDSDPAKAYDLWSQAYDDQPGNLMLDMDEHIFRSFLSGTQPKSAVIADIGCGTGRHWQKLLQKSPSRLIGFDVSPGMLEKLKNKYPNAETFLLPAAGNLQLEDKSVDLLISTLTIAHIPDLSAAFFEWDRVLKQSGEIIITDYHPEALAKGGKRTFSSGKKTVSIKNHIHSIASIRELSRQLGWTELRFTERVIDDSVKGYYEKQNALQLFEQFREVPIIYGVHFKKSE